MAHGPVSTSRRARQTQNQSRVPAVLLLSAVLIGLLAGCSGGSGGGNDSSDDSSSTSTTTTTTTNTDTVDTSTADVGDCEADTDIATVVCAANAFLATLSSSELATAQYDWSDSTAKTTWSNFPTSFVQRNGLRFGDMESDSLAAALAVAKAALSDSGYEDFAGTLAADDYLQDQGGGSEYSSTNYYIAIFGTPGVSNYWMLQIGGHHLAYNITYLAGTGYPVPNHIGAEPKASFELNSTTYAPLQDEGDALVAMFNALSSTELDYAYLSGQSYSDVVMGPDNGSGELPTDYPYPSEGVLVSSLSSDKQALVKAAIAQWVEDYAGDASDALTTDYTSDTALAETYIAWAGTQSAGVDVDVSGTYMRIDGPRLWIEVACQTGVVIRSQTHYHTIFRDKTMDYGNSL